MDDLRFRELTAAVRMTCSNHTLTGHTRPNPLIVSFDDSPRAIELSRGREYLREIAEKQNVRPVPVFASNVKPEMLAETLDESIRVQRAVPNAVAIEDWGFYTVGRTRREALRYNTFLLAQQPYHLATDQEETMYQRLAGRVVIVTGSAQGFGKGIAEELVREGAHIVIADLNDEAGQKTRDEFGGVFGSSAVTFCHLDVTDPASIDRCITHAFVTFGGLDIFVSNAGVLKAGPLEEMDPAAFDFVTKVNYTAYFLCAKAAASCMRIQRRYNKHHPMDIVQINSKSGLTGSNKNFAYSGSKFGGIGLTQSFAMELVDDNIKVNAICPGNYFEGPLWSDPATGLFVQYLNAGKVPGAKSLEDVKKFYMNKVPMKRGCYPRDVARAIIYCHEQEYETGQAVPVTGGQVMLS